MHVTTQSKEKAARLSGRGCWLAVALLTAPTAFAQAPSAADNVHFFETKVRPVLVTRCYACHSAATKPAGGLRVDDRNGLLQGGDSGPAVIPGDPDASLLLTRIRHTNPKRRMPKEGDPLTDAELKDLDAWINNGAAWPAEQLPASLGKSKASYERLRARHWAYQPLKQVPVPEVNNPSWARNEIDRFILAKLNQKKLSPVRDAGRRDLIRRLTFDLTGLPPAPAEIEAFVGDKHANAYERLVDQLLASPRFGERWGRHWLDVARYGESTGPSRNIPYPHAWRYRDYVIDAVNRDLRFDRFLQEQVAGDLLPAANAEERDRLRIATGFLALGPKDVNQRFKERFLMDNVDEKIDTISRSALGLTVSCARCHDHKFEPIPVTDYYALAGIFTSTEDRVGVLSKMGGAGLDYYDRKSLATLSSVPSVERTARIAQLEAEVAVAKKEWDEIRGTTEGLTIGPNGRPKQQAFRFKYERLQAELLFLTDPGSRGYGIHSVGESKRIADTAIRIRGEAERLGPVVPRGFPTTFAVPGAPIVDPAQSGRLQLAQWLTSSQNPLTPRVTANRVWQHLFGEGIVKTVDNFGVTGDRPSHPELLDYLASELIASEWSVKRLVRKIVLSRAYQLSSEATPSHKEIDPGNRWVWRHSPRRLDAEEVRDAMLFAAGTLQLQPPQASASRSLRMVEMQDTGPEARSIQEQANASLSRSVYLPLLRGVTPSALQAFDPVTQTLVTGHRDATTVPAQALFLLNSSFVRKQALSLARSLLKQQEIASPAKIKQAYRFALGRAPTTQELGRAHRFLADYQASYRNAPRKQALMPVVASAVVAKTSSSESPGFTLPVDPDNIDRTEHIAVEEVVEPESAKAAAWMSFVQALYASAEFRFVR
jgi:hypothetical protein